MKRAAAKAKPQEAKQSTVVLQRLGLNVACIRAALAWCQMGCSLMKSLPPEDLFKQQKEMLDIASMVKCVPASQKHQARVAKHNTSLKLPPIFPQQLPETWLAKGCREGRHRWCVFGQVSWALQWTLGHLNPRVWAELLHSRAVNSSGTENPHTKVLC